jgi:hypothetical protein
MMTSTQQSEPAARMELPRPDGDISGVVSSMIIVFFVVVAFFNLANYRILPVYPIVLSVIWLLIVALGLLMIFSEVYEHGIRQFVVVQLAPFSPHHFIEAPQQVGDDQIVRFGFILFKRQFIQLQISRAEIASIEWSSGQSTSLAGRDMNDWHAVVWFHRQGSKRAITTGSCREDTPHLVGSAGPRTEAAATSRALVAFLESAGIAFRPSPNECGFSTCAARSDQV